MSQNFLHSWNLKQVLVQGWEGYWQGVKAVCFLNVFCMFKWCKKIISLHKIGNISQTIHPYILRHHGGGSASFCEVHSSARFRMDCSVTPIVVDLTVQGFSGDDPRGGAPPLKGVWSFHAFLDLFPWSWFAILCGLTYWKQKHRDEL